MDDTELRAFFAAQARVIAEFGERIPRPVEQSIALRELYKSYEKANKHRPGWRTTMYVVRPFVDRYHDRDVLSLMAADWTAYRVTRDDLAPNSLNLALRLLKCMIRWGRLEGYYKHLPQICEAKKEKAKRHRETAPAEKEIGMLLNEIGPRLRVTALCAADSGMRNNEIRLLEHHWIDRVCMAIHIPSAVTKTKKQRSVPVTRRLLDAIDSLGKIDGSPYVLTSPRGGPYSRNYMSTMLRMAAEDAGLRAVPGERRVHLHDLRHAYATNAASRGVRIEVIQRILGHASLQQTQDYVQARPDDLDEARKTFEDGIRKDRQLTCTECGELTSDTYWTETQIGRVQKHRGCKGPK